MNNGKLVKIFLTCAIVAGVGYYMVVRGIPRMNKYVQKATKEASDHSMKIFRVSDVPGKLCGKPQMLRITVYGDSSKYCQEYEWPKHFDMPQSPDYDISILSPYCSISIAEIKRATSGINRAITRVAVEGCIEQK